MIPFSLLAINWTREFQIQIQDPNLYWTRLLEYWKWSTRLLDYRIAINWVLISRLPTRSSSLSDFVSRLRMRFSSLNDTSYRPNSCDGPLKLFDYGSYHRDRSIKLCLSIDAIAIVRSKIAWVLKSIKRDATQCLSIDLVIAIDATWSLEYLNWSHAIAWVLISWSQSTRCDAWVLKLITINRPKLLEYQTRSIVRSKIASVLKSIARYCLSIDLVIAIDVTWCLSIEIDRPNVMLEYWNRPIEHDCLSIDAML